MINIDSLNFGYNAMPIFKDLSVDFNHKLNIIIGPNATGKSTLLKCIFGQLKAEGRIRWNGRDFLSLPKDERMDMMVYLPQEEMPKALMTVFETTLLGKLPSLRWKLTDRDLEKVYGTLRACMLSRWRKDTWVKFPAVRKSWSPLPRRWCATPGSF